MSRRGFKIVISIPTGRLDLSMIFKSLVSSEKATELRYPSPVPLASIFATSLLPIFVYFPNSLRRLFSAMLLEYDFSTLYGVNFLHSQSFLPPSLPLQPRYSLA